MEPKVTFMSELQALINRYSMENGSHTPDYILAEYMSNCLLVFDQAVNSRERWHGRVIIKHGLAGDKSDPGLE
jgi:hypothetical protein